MEQNESLFSLSIDPVTKSHLSETSRWTKVLAIGGIVCVVLIVAAGIYQYILLSRFDDVFGRGFDSARISIIIGYILVLLLIFFPVLYLFRFSARMKTAIDSNDQNALNEAFLYMKVYFRYLGIITVISLVLFGLSFIIGIVGGATLGG